MNITEVRVTLVESNHKPLLAYCSITIDDAFVVHDLKIIEGARGRLVDMPSRKLMDRCQDCDAKNHLQARFCNACGCTLRAHRRWIGADGQDRLHAPVAHPINAVCRAQLHSAVLAAYDQERQARENVRPARS